MSSNLINLYRKLDVLNLVQNHGINKAVSIYLLGSIGSICLMLSVLLLAINSQGINQTNNNEILNLVSNWNFQNDRQSVLNQQYQMTLTNLNNNILEKDVKLEIFQIGNNLSSLSKSIGILEENQKKEIVIPTAYHQASVDFLKTKHLENKKVNEMCLSLDVKVSEKKEWYPIQGLINCGLHKRSGIMIKRESVQTLTVQEMQLQGVCQQEQCESECLSSEGTFKDNKCHAIFYVQEICVVMNPSKNQRVFSVQNGCYDGKIEKLSLKDNHEILVTVRDVQDPYLKFIQMTQTGSQEFVIQQEPHVLLARTIFTIGALCFLLSTILIIIFTNQSIKPVDIELQVLQPRKQNQIDVQAEPEQHFHKRSVPINY